MLGKVLKSVEAMVKPHGYKVAKMVVKDPMFLCPRGPVRIISY